MFCLKNQRKPFTHKETKMMNRKGIEKRGKQILMGKIKRKTKIQDQQLQLLSKNFSLGRTLSFCSEFSLSLTDDALISAAWLSFYSRGCRLTLFSIIYSFRVRILRFSSLRC